MQIGPTEALQAEAGEMIISNDKLINRNKDISILLIEDEKNIRELLKDILEPYYDILEAEDGEEGLKKTETDLPDIIISDILMPRLDGIALIDRLKSNEKTAHIPIINISARNSVEDHINAYEHGTDIYISKPFHPTHVLSAVESTIKKMNTLKKYFNSSLSSVTVKNGKTIPHEDDLLLRDIIKFVENNLDDETLNPDALCEFTNISKAGLYRKMKELTGRTPSEFIRTIRLEHSSKMLKTTHLTVSEIMFESGFANKSYFYREFARQYGCSPKEYREKFARETKLINNE